MSDVTFDLLDESQAGKVAAINELFSASMSAGIFGRRLSTSSGLTWGYYGGRYGGTFYASGTVFLTASATNYIVRKISDGTISASTATTNWNDTANYQRLFKATTDTTGVTESTVEDHRNGPNGVYGIGQAAYTETTADFTQPSVAGTVSVSVRATSWMTVGQYLFVGGGGGFYSVDSITDPTTVVLTNSGGSSNATPGATVASGSGVSSSGSQGTAGAAGVGTTPTAVKTANYTAAAYDFVPCDISGGSFTVTLPTAPTDGTLVGVQVVAIAGTNTLTVSAAGGDVFNVSGGSTSKVARRLFDVMLFEYSSGIWYAVVDSTRIAPPAPYRSTSATGTVTPDAATYKVFLLTLTGNITLANPTGLSDGDVLTFKLKQDPTGSRTLTLGSKYKTAGGTPTLSTAAGALDLLSYVYDATDDQLVGSFGANAS